MTARCRAFFLVAVSVSALALAGCNEPRQAQTAEVKTVPQVAVVTVEPSARSFVRELPGRVTPARIADVRARVAGIVVARTFTQGADVEAGQVLFRIDPAPFEVELQAANAALAKAEAARQQAEAQVGRVNTLVMTNAASKVQQETAVATWKQAEADVAARRADVARAKLNLEYTTVRAPIKGRVDAALVTEGALVGQGEATRLATIQQLDPIYADFTQSVSELQQLRRDLADGTLEKASDDSAKVRLEFSDGTSYQHDGKLLFSGVTVDPTTGQVTLRGEFPNPKRELLPGMYVRVQIEQGVDHDSLAVPQQAVQRDDVGNSYVFVVNAEKRVRSQPVSIGSAFEDQWLIMDGLKPGDKVVAEGFQKFIVGDVVDASPWQSRLARAATRAQQPETVSATGAVR
ncbi:MULTISPECIES: efflux RND transporter periplasmic adaptor subunit [unclassified Beijerinckia]|uniref:efflux RND transporter periplasmic adaptor subunit n=1 Tax=unclassified Beijerinckia TaxID=2638183 RepID=UPI00089B30A7|nr:MULTISPECIES: efflux RND transporter periplasmic adaptor subunit [unclassified Beijerinckia]MDH7797131.1 membrane fusion protein (multidrug efflux system) [Beijerinckia sp. GAS462]SEC73471.1 membrane fusion protein, multidrug efflux system [Beijerinckia sp. 28-YEA-48]